MKKTYLKTFTTILILILTLLYCLQFTSLYNETNSNSNYLTVYFIDVGQGDCILVNVNGYNLLIDSGPSSARKSLLGYLDKLSISKFDYVIATHPHEDHIGNMDAIIRKYHIGKFLAPKVTASTLTFENMVTALNDKNLKISVISTGSNSINLGKETSIMFYTLPNLNTDDELNLYSPIIKLTYKNISFLFTGDAELKNEEFLIKNEINLRSHILKIGHHGSSSSTCEAFLNSVNPKVAIISVGSNNKYGHPAASTLNLLKNYHIKLYRTDLLGTIILKSDGSSFSILYQWKKWKIDSF